MRNEIVRQARLWLQTPYMHFGRYRNVGVDCFGLVACVGADLGLISVEWKLHKNYTRMPDGTLQPLLEANMTKVEVPQIGSVLLFRIRRQPQHLAIMTGSNTMIHAYQDYATVREHVFDELWLKRLVAAFDYPGVVD